MVPPETVCSKKADLLSALRSTVAAIIELNNRQVAAAMAGEMAVLQVIDSDLRREQRQKSNLLYALMKHVREHHC